MPKKHGPDPAAASAEEIAAAEAKWDSDFNLAVRMIYQGSTCLIQLGGGQGSHSILPGINLPKEELEVLQTRVQNIMNDPKEDISFINRGCGGEDGIWLHDLFDTDILRPNLEDISEETAYRLIYRETSHKLAIFQNRLGDYSNYCKRNQDRGEWSWSSGTLENELYSLFIQQGLGWALPIAEVSCQKRENAVDIATANGWSLGDAVDRGECKVLSINLSDGIFLEANQDAMYNLKYQKERCYENLTDHKV